MNFVINILFLPVLFFVGIITSYEDAKWGKIRNKWTVFGLSWGVGTLILLSFWNFINEPVSSFFYYNFLNKFTDLELFVFKVDFSFVLESFSNILIAVAVSFLMWRFNAWTAGDAKLFMAYSALVPLGFYWKTYLPFFPAFALMVNMFILVLFYLAIKSIFLSVVLFIDWIKKEENKMQVFKKIDFKKIFKKIIKNMLFRTIRMMLGFLLVIILFSLLAKPFQDDLPFDLFTLQAIIFATLIIFSTYLMKFLQKPLVFRIILVALIVVCSYGLITDFYFALRVILQSATLLLLFICAFMLLHQIINAYVEKKEKKIINIKKLKSGMNLNEGELDRLSFKRLEGLKGAGGLTKEQVKVIKEQARKKNIDKVSIYKTFPFAFWMFLGVLLTLRLKGSVITLLIRNLMG